MIDRVIVAALVIGSDTVEVIDAVDGDAEVGCGRLRGQHSIEILALAERDSTSTGSLTITAPIPKGGSLDLVGDFQTRLATACWVIDEQVWSG